MAIAVKELRSSVDPNTLVKLDYPSENYSSPTISEDGNGHHKALGETIVVFKTPKPDDNRNGTESDLTPLDLARYCTGMRAGDRAERKLEQRFGHNGKNNNHTQIFPNNASRLRHRETVLTPSQKARMLKLE